MISILIIIICLVLVIAILLGLGRIFLGPSVVDRILAFDMVAISAAGLMAILSLYWRTSLYLELILIFSLLGFMGTVALVGYMEKSQQNVGKDEEE